VHICLNLNTSYNTRPGISHFFVYHVASGVWLASKHACIVCHDKTHMPVDACRHTEIAVRHEDWRRVNADIAQIPLRTYPRDHHLKPLAYKRQLVHKGFCCKQLVMLLLDQLFAIRAIFQGQRDVAVQAEVWDAVYVAQGITMHHDEVARVVES